MSDDFNEWVDYMSQWQDIVRDVPAIVHQDIQKARMKPQEPSRGMQSLTEDPLAAQYALGYKDRRYSLTYDVLKRIPHQLAVIGAIIQVRQNQVAAFSAPYRLSKSIGFEIKHKDPSHLTSKSEQRFIRDLEQFVYNCGNPDPNPHSKVKRDDFETFLKKIVRDSLTLDQACHLAGSWVELADGTGCPIEDIQEGMEVRTHTGEIKKVLYPTQRLYSGELVTIHVRGQRVTVTSGHPVYAAKRCLEFTADGTEVIDPDWVPAGELTEDMWVVYPRSARCSEMADYWGVYKDENSLHTHLYVFSQIESIEKYEDENVPVYNMEVEDDHSYIAQGFLNHNCVEIVPDRRGIPYEFMAVDGSTIRIAAQNSVYGPNQSYQPRSPGASPRILNAMGQDARGPYNTMKLYENAGNKEPAYVQVTNGQVHTVYTEDELMFGVRNPRTDIYIQGYGYSELEQLVTIVTAHLNAETYNRKFFTQGSHPKGILNIKGDAMTPDMLEGFRRQWRATLEGVEQCLSGDTRIYTQENGFESLANICGDKPEVPVRLWTGKEWATGLVYKTSEPKKLCNIVLDDGGYIESSPDHKFMALDESGEFVWREQKDISEGDVLLIESSAEESFSPDEYNTATVVSTHSSDIYIPMYDVSVDTEDHAFVANNIVCHNSWKTPILQAEQGLDWIDLHPSNRDMEFNAWIEYLLKVSCAIYMIDPAELNFDLHGGVSQTPLFESSQEWKLKASRDKGLKPLLRFIAKQLNEHVISKIDSHYMIEFSGLDEPTEQEKHTLYSEQVSSYLTLNEIRRAQDRPDLKYGDMPMSPAYLQAMQIQQQQEQMEQQQQQEQAMQGQQPQQPQEEVNEEPQEGQQRQGNAPEYADSFGKSQSAREGKYLEIDISELDDWKDSL